MNEATLIGEKVSKLPECAKSENAGLVGIVKSWQTDLKGNVIPGTLKEDRNTIQDGLKKYLAACIGATASVDKRLVNLFDQDYGAGGDPLGVAINDKSGIAYYNEADQAITDLFYTELNAGGTGGEPYIEFYGYITGAITMYGQLVLGYKITFAEPGAGGPTFNTEFAKYDINETVAADRRYHFYWKITLG